MNTPIVNEDYKTQRLATFFRDQKFVDCTFKIDGNEIRAHKLILACSSPVFEKMLFGEMASDEIALGDTKVEDFSQMLDFIYTARISFKSTTNAWSMFYIAQKYLLDVLANICLAYISKHLTMSTLVLSYEYAELYNLEQMKAQCFQDIIDGINGVFASDYHMKPSTLRTILQEDIVMTRIDLICKLIEWSINECEYTNVSSTPENVVQILKTENILRYITKRNIKKLKCEYCNDRLVVCRCVTETIHKTLRYLSSEVSWEEKPKADHFRKFLPFICKLKKVYKIARRIDLLESEEFVSSVSVNTDTLISGMFLCTEMNSTGGPLEEYDGRVVIRFCEKDSNSDLVKPTIAENVFQYNSQIYIPLRYAAPLKPEKMYDIKISYKNWISEMNSSIVCSYMSDELVDRDRGYTRIYFYDVHGTVIKGVSFYPL